MWTPYAEELVGNPGGPHTTWFDNTAASIVRENNCIQLLTVLEARDGQAWSVKRVAEEAMVPLTTARRLLFPEVTELRPYSWILTLRSRENLSSSRSSEGFITTLVSSYYGRMLTSFSYIGVRNGVEVVRVNTSQFEILQRVGAEYGFQVTFDPKIRSTERGPSGRVRARYVATSSRWSREERAW